MRQGILLHLGGLQMVLVAAYGLVGLSHHCYNVVSVVHQPAQCTDSELRCAHKHDA